MYTLHEMRPTGNGEWEYVQERTAQEPKALAPTNSKVADGLWEAYAATEEQEQAEATITVPLINGDAAAIKRLAAQESEKNLGLRVQPDGDCTIQLKVKTSRWKAVLPKSRQATFQQEQCGRATPSNCGQVSNTDSESVRRLSKNWKEDLAKQISTS